MPDQETLNLIESIQDQLDVFEATLKDMNQMHTIQSILLFKIYSQLNPEQAEEIKEGFYHVFTNG
jgi:capsule polysaccharide modification protein KpsS